MTRTITVKFDDNQSFTSDEIIENLESIYGNNAEIEVYPASKTPEAYIQYGISELLTPDQAVVFYDEPDFYPEKLKVIRHEMAKKLLYILNDVIMENEEKFSN